MTRPAARYLPHLLIAIGMLVMPSSVGWHSVVKANDDLEASALAIAPADAAFFNTSLNMRDAWQDLVNGRLVSRLRAVPFIQELEGEFMTQWENPQGELAQAKAMMENPNIKNVLDLLTEMMSDEAFVYGGDDWCGTIEGMMAFQNEMTNVLSRGPDAAEEFLTGLTAEDIAELKIPTTVIGFRLRDDENARLQLDALEGILRIGGSQIPEAKPFLQRLKRTDLENGQTLSITLDPSLIPLDQLSGDEAEMAEQVVRLFEGRSISFAMGVKENVVLFAFSEDANAINLVGEADEKLITAEPIKVLLEEAPANLRSIGYASKRFRESQWKAQLGNYFQRIATQLTVAIEQQAGGAPGIGEWLEEINKDAVWMDERLSEVAYQLGAVLTWSVATEDGGEGYMYDWGQNLQFKNASPLSVTQHGGSESLMLFAFKQRNVPEADEMAEYILDRMPGHITRFVELAEEDEEERERVLAILEGAFPLVQDAWSIMKNDIGPALGENESLISFAGGWSTSFLGPGMPAPENPLPLPEVGGACHIQDRAQFLAGCEKLYGLLDRVVEYVRTVNPGSVPEGYTVPRPVAEEIDGGTRYYYEEFAQAVPLPGFEPQLIVGDDVLVFGYSDRQVRDMFEPKELSTRPGWMNDEFPTAAVSYMDFAGMVATVRPWLEFGLAATGQSMDAPLSPAPGPIPTGNDVLQIWDCFKTAGKMAATVTVSDDGPTVTRWVWVTE